MSTWKIASLILFFVILVLCGSAVLAYFALPNWEVRGQFGDTFGFVNTLFSGLAFAALIYSINLQRSEFNKSIEELRESRELQAQPLPLPERINLKIERPRLFYTPPERKHSFNSRLHLTVEMKNKSSFPAIGVNSTVRLLLPKFKQYISSTDYFVAIVPGESPSEQKLEADHMFMEQNCQTFECLNQPDPRNVPILLIVIVFRNALGGAFAIEQSFACYVENQDIEVLKNWHSDIQGFAAKYRTQVEELVSLRTEKQIEKWNANFEELRSIAERNHDPDSLELFVAPIPSKFRFRKIDIKKYEEQIDSSSYAQFVSERYDCPSSIDSQAA